ncbi:hypothetical protein EVAR_37917_1 [Eumeta japonica]|uniref:Uncharacterized protein n=1 Tax=Eumeta variegata TaxID=151549 RepID=A0A4C1XGQ8_EUMVA|nr:hypothetical protein EVAR_37917_1 [Eumeta japonica]
MVRVSATEVQTFDMKEEVGGNQWHKKDRNILPAASSLNFHDVWFSTISKQWLLGPQSSRRFSYRKVVSRRHVQFVIFTRKPFFASDYGSYKQAMWSYGYLLNNEKFTFERHTASTGRSRVRRHSPSGINLPPDVSTIAPTFRSLWKPAPAS